MTPDDRLPTHSSSFGPFMDEFVSESDRAAVILGAAKVEHLLGEILDKFLLPCASGNDDLLEGDAPLATFSAKIKIAHRLGLIDSQFAKLLNTFRRLRNGFAHEVTTGSLSTGAARDRVFSLADPFAASAFFQEMVSKVANQMGREKKEAGVIFRAVLGLFHIHLLAIYDELKPCALADQFGIAARAMTAKVPKKADH